MKSQAEDETAPHKVPVVSGPQTAKEEKESETQYEGGHDGPETDTREIDGPEGSRSDKSGNESRESPLEEFFSEKIEPQDGQCPENDGPEFKGGDGSTESFDGERLEVDKKSLAAVIIGIKYFVVPGFVGVHGVSRVDRFIRVDGRRNVFDVIASDEEREQDDKKQSAPRDET